MEDVGEKQDAWGFFMWHSLLNEERNLQILKIYLLLYTYNL